ncbi:MAG: glycosyltransferase family 2 protein [Chloroflexi bacterium]|nr:glycosyltransferase family 2 protein [Chloroflexota bacterium]
MSVEESAPALSVVLPAYNEQARLPYTLGELARYIRQQRLDCEVIVVDNGSTDATSVVVQQALTGFPSRLRLIRTDRRGKGLAVRVGMLAARGRVVLFADADLSWSLGELERFPALVDELTPVVIGSREGSGARRVDEPGYRHLMGRVFNRIVQWLALPGIEDSQCGFKAFSADAARAIFSLQTLAGFGFDVEILFLARRLGYGILVVPRRWEHKENSRVAALSDTLRMLCDVARVRWRAQRGVYALPQVASSRQQGASSG